ncbi:MAG TPA: GDSL-type esterase/lipase family protein [Mycobacteriales bacterium]|nr:GDSL-type esterase/lipase family protein [Mycobacteriales bacterium]
MNRVRLGVAAVSVLGSVLLAAPPARAAGVVRVYPLGDSITFGNTATANTPGGYRGPLDALLTASGVTHEFVGAVADNSTPVLDAEGQAHHDGHPGYRIDQDAADLDGDAHSYYDAGGYWLTGTASRAPIVPDVTIVHLGTNDIGQRWDPGTVYPTGDGLVNYGDPAQRAAFVAHMTARLEGLVDKLLALRPDSRVVLSNVIPIGLTGVDLVTGEYGTAIADLVARERAAGKRVVLADVWSRFAQATPAGVVLVPGLLCQDAVHPTVAGYAVMAAVYRDAVLAALALP